jgi:hypothetical protein
MVAYTFPFPTIRPLIALRHEKILYFHLDFRFFQCR